VTNACSVLGRIGCRASCVHDPTQLIREDVCYLLATCLHAQVYARAHRMIEGQVKGHQLDLVLRAFCLKRHSLQGPVPEVLPNRRPASNEDRACTIRRETDIFFAYSPPQYHERIDFLSGASWPVPSWHDRRWVLQFYRYVRDALAERCTRRGFRA
jgi:hypothetical protein